MGVSPIRDLPYFRDLRAFVGHLDDSRQLARVTERVSTVHEMTEIHRRVLAAGGPALLFEHPTRSNGSASEMQTVVNLFGTVSRVAWGPE
jgi:4-hydroxy-3-polyprenylbenzoate decarboxylase